MECWHIALMPKTNQWFRKVSNIHPICYYAILVTFWAFGFIGRAHAQDFPVVVEKDLIRVEAPAGHEKYAAAVLGHATAALRTLNSQTRDALLVPVRFVVAADEKQFLQFAGGEGEQSLAVALGEDRLVVISMPAMAQSAADKFQQVLVHELAHVYLEVKCNAPVPRWLHEGVAQVVAGEWPDIPGEGSMAIAAYTGGLIPLRDLVATFPQDITRRNQAYAQAYSITRFIIREDHSGSLAHFLNSITGDKGTAYLQSLGATIKLDGLFSRWRGELKSPLFTTTFLLSSGFFWGVAALLVIVAYFIKRRQSKVIRRQWSEEDAVWVNLEQPTTLSSDPDDPENYFLEGDGEDWKRGEPEDDRR